MPRRKGFSNEDYELAQDIDRALNLELGTAIPSKVCDAAETWALFKIRKRAKQLWDAGQEIQAAALFNACALLESGEL